MDSYESDLEEAEQIIIFFLLVYVCGAYRIHSLWVVGTHT